jgi:hypothetical protein
MIDRTIRARQREAIRDLGGDVAFQARFESQHWSHLLIDIAGQFQRTDTASALTARYSPFRVRRYAVALAVRPQVFASLENARDDVNHADTGQGTGTSSRSPGSSLPFARPASSLTTDTGWRC